MAIKTLDDLFNETLKDLYYAEKKLVKTLPKMMKRAGSSHLKGAIEGHLVETEGHVTRLEEVFAMMGKKPVAKKCEAIEGLLKEADEVMTKLKAPKLWMPQSFLPHKRSSTTRLHAMARWSAGPASWAWMMLRRYFTERSMKKKLPTRNFLGSQRNTSISRPPPEASTTRYKKRERPIRLSLFLARSEKLFAAGWAGNRAFCACSVESGRQHGSERNANAETRCAKDQRFVFDQGFQRIWVGQAHMACGPGDCASDLTSPGIGIAKGALAAGNKARG